jgi:hypothetical protein
LKKGFSAALKDDRPTTVFETAADPPRSVLRDVDLLSNNAIMGRHGLGNCQGANIDGFSTQDVLQESSSGTPTRVIAFYSNLQRQYRNCCVVPNGV